MGEISAILSSAANWAYSLFDQMAFYDGRVMFLSGLVSSFVISQLVSWITSSALRLAIIGGVIVAAGTGLVSVLPKPGTQPGMQAPSTEQLAKQAPQPSQGTAQQPIRLAPPQTQAPVRRN